MRGVDVTLRTDRNMEVQIVVREELLREVRRLQRENTNLRSGSAVYRERRRQAFALGRRKK